MVFVFLAPQLANSLTATSLGASSPAAEPWKLQSHPTVVPVVDPVIDLVYCYGRLGLASETPATIPTATTAPTTNAVLMENLRTRFCLAGAIAAPDGVDAGTPSGRVSGAAAVPSGVGACAGV